MSDIYIKATSEAVAGFDSLKDTVLYRKVL